MTPQDLSNIIARLATSPNNDLEPADAIEAVAKALVTMIDTSERFGYEPPEILESVIRMMRQDFSKLRTTRNN